MFHACEAGIYVGQTGKIFFNLILQQHWPRTSRPSGSFWKSILQERQTNVIKIVIAAHKHIRTNRYFLGIIKVQKCIYF